MIEAVVFDIDGTLNDWESSINRALKGVRNGVPEPARPGLAVDFGAALSEYAFERRGGVVVNRQFWKLLVDPLPPWEAILPDTPAETVRDIAGGFRSLLRPVPYQDAAPTLEAVKGQYRLGVLSNSPRPEQILSDLGLRHYFSAVVFPGDEARKPEPHAFSLICERMGVEARQAVNVGDTISHDVEGALAAGLRAVWVDRYGEEHPLPVGAVRIGSLRELPEALSRLD